MFGNLFGGKKKPTTAAGAGPGGNAANAAKLKGLAEANKKAQAAAKAKDQAPAAHRPAKLRRENLKRFTILAETGRGSMSRVYRALDTKSGRVVCLKVQDREKTEAALARAAQIGRPTEGEIGAALTHPNVVRTYEYGLSTKKEYYIVMEFVEGINLQELRQSRVLDVAERAELLAQAASGLAAVHAAGFIHRDIGPKNLLVDHNDRVKLIDFGLTVPNTPTFRRPGNRTGTINYMAPELLRREPTDERIDIFSFGATAFEFLAGRLPFDAILSVTDMMQRINSPPHDPAKLNPRLPAPLCDLLLKMLARLPADRWPKMATLPEAFRAAAGLE